MDQTLSFTKPITSPLTSFIFIILLVPSTAFADVDPKYLACVPKSCGDDQIIKFPFYIRNQQEPFCGYPGFQISCNEKGNPVLNLSSNFYIIKQIFYDNQSLRVSDAEADSETNNDVCTFPRLKNFSLPDERFSLVSNQTAELILLYNCRTPLPKKLLQYKAANCPRKDETRTVLALYEDNSDLGSASEKCREKVAAPVEKYGEESEIGNIAEMVKRGFLLQWIASNCNVCQASGGKCGFDESIYHFQCYCQDRPHSKHCHPGNGTRRLKISLGIASGLLLLIAILAIYFIRIRKRQKYASRNLQSANTSSLTSSKSDLETSTVYFGAPIFSYSDLSDATNNFNHEKELGDGGFGTVYHGKLRDGREVAVKRLYENNYRRVEQFMNEIEILTRLRHKNLVSLYGCTSRHSQGLLLVYEFVPNGTVADHLHGGRAKSGFLSWPVRMNIAVETASALAYLHASDIIHRDVKTNNILLDNNFGVKVADFGLSRLFPTDVTHISTAPQGTPGYVDPEYHQCYQLTDKSDVYSFGVVLVELISSMPAVDITRHRHEINLANLAINKIQKCEFDELIDPCIGYDSDKEVKRMTTSVAELAFLCVQQNKEMRPSMDVVLEELERIQNGEPKYDNQNEKQYDIENLKSIQPPSPAHCDEVSLLKNIRLTSSPISVTEKWNIRERESFREKPVTKMATLQKFKILATQCGVAQSPTRSPRTSPLVQIPRKKTTLRMLLTRNTSSSSRTTNCNGEPLPSPKEIVAEEKKRDRDLISQRNNKLKDLFVSSFEEEEKVEEKNPDKAEILCTMKKLHGVGSELGLNKPGWVGFRHRLLLRKAWRPMLVTIPE